MDFSGIYRSETRWVVDLDGVGLWVVCASYCADNCTSFVPEAFMKANVPRGNRRRALRTLVDEGVLVAADKGYVLTTAISFDGIGRSDLSRKRSEAGQKGAAARWGANDLPSGKRDFANGNVVSFATTDEEEVVKKTFSEEVERLCSLLSSLVVANGGRQPRITNRWRQECDRLINRDERPVDEIERVIRWCQADEFWQSNVLSMPTLRKQYDRLLMRSGAAKPARSQAEDDAAFIARLNGGAA